MGQNYSHNYKCQNYIDSEYKGQNYRGQSYPGNTFIGHKNARIAVDTGFVPRVHVDHVVENNLAHRQGPGNNVEVDFTVYPNKVRGWTCVWTCVWTYVWACVWTPELTCA